MAKNVTKPPKLHKNAAALSQFLRTPEGEVEITRYKAGRIRGGLLEELVDFDSVCFPGYDRSDSRHEIVASDRVYVVRRTADGEIIGMAAISMEGRTAQWNTSSVAESERGKGIYQTMTYLRIMEGLTKGVRSISVQTQNANVEYGIERVLGRLVELGAIKTYTIGREEIKDFYGCRVAGNAGLDSSSERINLEYAKLDRRNGDAFELTITITPQKKKK
jgi:hypothetical protein